MKWLAVDSLLVQSSTACRMIFKETDFYIHARWQMGQASFQCIKKQRESDCLCQYPGQEMLRSEAMGDGMGLSGKQRNY